jgi:glycosyltransferase 2 family protein
MRRLLLPFKFAVSGLLIVVVFRNIDLASFADRFAGQSRLWLIAAALITLAQILLFALRWDQIVKGLGARVPIEAVIRVSYIGAFCNSWLVGNVGGDVARAALAPEGGIGRVKIIYSVLFDRVITLAGLGLVMLPVIALNIGPLARSIPVFAALGVAALPIIGLCAIGVVAPLIGGRASAVMRRLRELGSSWRLLCRTPGRLGAALGIATVSQIAIPAIAYSLARAQHLDVSFVDFLLLIPPVVLVAALPISIGGWGVRENAMIIALAPIGVAAGSALLIAVQLALLASLLSLPGGILWLAHYGLRRGPAAARQPARAP